MDPLTTSPAAFSIPSIGTPFNILQDDEQMPTPSMSQQQQTQSSTPQHSMASSPSHVITSSPQAQQRTSTQYGTAPTFTPQSLMQPQTPVS